jgi:pyridoxal biosynthesis lyase PdxS
MSSRPRLPAAGAVVVMALESPADIVDGGVLRVVGPSHDQGDRNAVTIPVMAKVRG